MMNDDFVVSNYQLSKISYQLWKKSSYSPHHPEVGKQLW